MSAPHREALREGLRSIWGYAAFRPLQEEAASAVMEGRDSIVILPTGGGKSLCFQLPAALMRGTALVVTPLIALMKDQVDALRQRGVAAGCLHSGLAPEERRETDRLLREGRLKLLYLSPERLMLDGYLETLATRGLSFVAVDEAHCISQWGHDFRKEYRMLGQLRERMPELPIHAYTATASEKVESDIISELSLRKPERHVGNFERGNLTYRVISKQTSPKKAVFQQVTRLLDSRKGKCAIVYCISRKDTEEMADTLRGRGHSAAAYHAGMTPELRAKTQENFLSGATPIVVATVAFGMGIDKADVRAVIHAGLPKSIEHYQQESGRAGRDGLPSECILLYSAMDAVIWRKLMDTPETTTKQLLVMQEALRAMEGYAAHGQCRTDYLLQHFGQKLEEEDCGHCDTCLRLGEDWEGEEMVPTEGAVTVAQKILSCVVRMDEKYGESLVTRVLVGSRDRRIGENGLDKLSTYGILRQHDRRVVRDWIQQLKAQECLVSVGVPPIRILQTTDRGWAAIRGELAVTLAEAKQHVKHTSKPAKTNSVGGAATVSAMAVEMALAGWDIQDIAASTSRARTTVEGYIADHFEKEGLTDPSPIVDPETAAAIEAAYDSIDHEEKLRPLRDHLGTDVSYLQIKVALACMRNRRGHQLTSPD
jgi:ATP-dependent DNA helicase RecQ